MHILTCVSFACHRHERWPGSWSTKGLRIITRSTGRCTGVKSASVAWPAKLETTMCQPSPNLPLSSESEGKSWWESDFCSLIETFPIICAECQAFIKMSVGFIVYIDYNIVSVEIRLCGYLFYFYWCRWEACLRWTCCWDRCLIELKEKFTFYISPARKIQSSKVACKSTKNRKYRQQYKSNQCLRHKASSS